MLLLLHKQGLKLSRPPAQKHKLAELVSAAQDQGLNMTACALDVSDLDSMTATLGALGRFDVLVNSAGMARHGPAADTKAADFDAVMAVNLRGAYFLSQQIANQMISAGTGGSIINISSQMAHVGGIERSVYCASKSAVEGFTKAMAIEWGPHQVRINTIRPTFARTALTNPPSRIRNAGPGLKRKIKLGRVGEVEDMMGGVVFLASDAAALITGTSLLIDGGWTAD